MQETAAFEKNQHKGQVSGIGIPIIVTQKSKELSDVQIPPPHDD